MNIEVPVLIVGGGGCGLSSSIYFSNLGVDHLLVERHPGTSHLPKGHYQNQRTMEIMRQQGIAELIYEHGTPMKYMSQIHWRSSIAGDKEYEGRNFFEFDAFGGGKLKETYEKDSPTPSTNIPQVRFEPLLRKVAENKAPGKVLFNHELTDWTQDSDGVTAKIKNRETNEETTVRAQYMIAADGGKTIGPKLGIEMEGPTGLIDMVSIYFKADLSKWMGDSRNLITFLPSPEGALSGLVPLGPTWGPNSEEWVIHQGMRPDDPKEFTEDFAVTLLQEMLRIPGFDPEIVNISHWHIEAVLAERYRENRIFLAGDAAHRHPPTTGLGLNTAFQDAHNLTWKLAAVLKGQASEEILNSYEPERKLVGRRNVDTAFSSFMNHQLLSLGIGFAPGQSKEEIDATIENFFADNNYGAYFRQRAREVFQTQRVEFQAHDVEIGFHYEEGAIISDGTKIEKFDPMGSVHYPTTRPGHRLPHAWITKNGKECSTLDLVEPGEFVLITGEDSNSWRKACEDVSKLYGLNVKYVSIGVNTEYEDPNGQWKEVREVSDKSAILVRPDQHVAWRTKVKVDSPNNILEEVLGEITGLKVKV